MEGAINKKDKDGGRRVNYQEIDKKEGEIREKGQGGGYGGSKTHWKYGREEKQNV